MDKDLIKIRIFHPDEIPAQIRQKLIADPGNDVRLDNQIYIMIDQTVICLPDDSSANEFVYAITKKNKGLTDKPQNEEEIYRKILSDPEYRPDPLIMHKCSATQNENTCIAVLRSFSATEQDLQSIILSMAPAESGDSIIPVDYHTAAFLKNLENQSEEEMTEYIEALLGTLETEGITNVYAGIGNVFSGIESMRNCYEEALEALRLGRKYHRQDHLYVYGKQTLEKIVDSIPEDKKNILLDHFFRQSTENKLSEEMLETVRVFFKNDLNLTAASKQLFIHRNTLNYRLDKIKKEFGLDLRSFDDSVVFRIVAEIANRS